MRRYILTVLLCSASLLLAAEHPGKSIYAKLCAECHGQQGEGVEGKYDEPLIGERSLDSLARKIDKTMPEEDPSLCSWEDSQKVAAYIYDAFYSKEAQARQAPAHPDLLRLTVPQFQNSVMDLLGSFHKGAGYDRPLSSEPGLRGLYRGFEPPKDEDQAKQDAKKQNRDQQVKNRKRSKLERIDHAVDFDFGTTSPDPATMRADEFQCRWEGSILATESGLYEFSVRSPNGFRLWVNDEETALIDGWVSPGPEIREEKKSLYLLGGRAYAIVLEHFKFKEPAASVQLWWKPPHGVRELIPSRALRKDKPRDQMVVSTPFPADDRSAGYERGSSISKEWDQAVTTAALSTVEYVERNLDRLAGTKSDAPDRLQKLTAFATNFMERAYQRPLQQQERQRSVDAFFQQDKDEPETAVKKAVLLTLKSPYFLYPSLRHERQDSHARASHLALALWDSLPDRELMQAAASDKLKDETQLRSQAERMVKDPRTKAKLHGFFHHWLELERAEMLSKDPKAFPGFDAQVMADLRQSLLHFIDTIVWEGSSDYRELLKSDALYLNERLAKLYGHQVTGNELQRVQADSKQRAGVVTHPYLLASLAYSKQSSPIHRGVFLTRNIVGMSLKPPAMAVAFEESHFDPSLTMREKVTQLTRSNNCMSCHSLINPLGFSLENFDAIGRWRTKDNNKPVNSAGEFTDEQGVTTKLTGPRDIVNYVADNPSGHRAFIRHLLQHTLQQQPLSYGPRTLDELQQNFATSNCNIRKLLVELALLPVRKPS